jgi:NitT/TauT family transport system substrate-binding protein
LLAGRLEVQLTSDPYGVLRSTAAKQPLVSFAAIFQRNPQVLMAHPDQGVASLADLKTRPIAISVSARDTWWPWLRQAYGYTDSQIRPLSYSTERFLQNKSMVQQGYLTDEPFQVRAAGVEPVVLLLAEYGFPPYAELLTARAGYFADNTDLLRRFLRASQKGWLAYLHGDRRPADKLIQTQNPRMTQEHLDYAVDQMIRHDIIENSDTKRHGIGHMTEAVWADFVKQNVALGVAAPDLDWRSGLRFDLVTGPATQ